MRIYGEELLGPQASLRVTPCPPAPNHTRGEVIRPPSQIKNNSYSVIRTRDLDDPTCTSLEVLWMIHFPCYRPETLDCTLSQTNFLTLTLPPTRYLKTLYTDNLYIWSRWSTSNRGRATSASEVIEVAGSNHAIGVILNLAWGPNNFSPSMIWSWRTRSNSQTGLGAE